MSADFRDKIALRRVVVKDKDCIILGGSISEAKHLILTPKNPLRRPSIPKLRKVLGEGWEFEGKLDLEKQWFKGHFWYAKRVGVTSSLGGVMGFLRKHILESEKNEGIWKLIGDETSALRTRGSDFSDFPEDRLFRYVWVMVPPKCSLPVLDSGYHGMDMEFSQTRNVITELLSHCDPTLGPQERVRIFIFEDRDRAAAKGREFQEYTLRFLPDTIPVVLEKIRMLHSTGGAKGDIAVQFLSEGYANDLTKRGMPLPWIDRYDDQRDIGTDAAFKEKPVEPSTFLAKDAHPYLGYADAVAFAMNADTFSKGIFEVVREKISAAAEFWSFSDAEVLSNGLVLPKNLANPRGFYRELRALPSSRKGNEALMRGNPAIEELVVFHSKRLANELSLTDFLVFEKGSRDTENYAWSSTRMIEDKGGIDSWINEVPEEAHKKMFDVCFSGFSFASRNSDSSEMKKFEGSIEELILGKMEDLDRGRVEHFKRVLEAEAHTVFHFLSEDESLLKIDDSDSRLETVAGWAFGPNAVSHDRHYLGSRLQRIAFRDGSRANPRVLELQRELRDVEIDSPEERSSHRRRHTTYLLEMLLDRSRNDPAHLDEALSIFEEAASEGDGMDFFRMAALLKLAVVFQENGMPIPEGIASLHSMVPEVIGNGNPSIRCMAWGARLCHIIGKEADRDRFFRIIRSRAEDAISGDLQPFTDAMGLTHACHLIDLESSDLESEKIGGEYLALVLEKSADSTRRWVSEHGSEDDLLKPLNFNYR